MEFINEILEQIPGIETTASRRLLHAGDVNQVWKVSIEDAHYVIRVSNHLAGEIGLSVDREFAVMQAADENGFGPEPVWCNAAAGILVSRYLPGSSLSEEAIGGEALENVAALMSKLHSCDPTLPAVDYAGYIGRYAASVKSPEADAQAAEALGLIGQWCSDSSRFVLCHTDPTAGNFISGNDGELRLIDWEYGGLGEPCFDLAVLIEHHGVDRESLLSEYTRFHEVDEDRLSGCVQLYRRMHALWSMMCCSNL